MMRKEIKIRAWFEIEINGIKFRSSEDMMLDDGGLYLVEIDKCSVANDDHCHIELKKVLLTPIKTQGIFLLPSLKNHKVAKKIPVMDANEKEKP